MNEQNFSMELDIKYINDNKKQLCDKWNELYDDENHEQGLYDIQECECNEVRIDNDGYINISIGDGNLSFFGNAKLTDDELIALHDSITEYFSKQVEKLNKILKIAEDDE